MFNWLSNTIKESVAPLFRSNLEQFVHTWGKVEEEYGAIMGKRGVDLGRFMHTYNALHTCIVHVHRYVDSITIYEYIQYPIARSSCVSNNVLL